MPGNVAVITDKNIINNTSLLVNRGYTSHEHFAEVGIIYMNGRLYDPLLRRFLNADENIQDPTNTQNYNKYGYVMNNPLYEVCNFVPTDSITNDRSGKVLLSRKLLNKTNWYLADRFIHEQMHSIDIISGFSMRLCGYPIGNDIMEFGAYNVVRE